MKRLFQTSLSCLLVSSALGQEVSVQEGVQGFPLSPDSFQGAREPLGIAQGDQFRSVTTGVQLATNPEEVTKNVASTPEASGEVLLIPTGKIKTSYSGKSDNDTIFLLKRAINRTQLQYKSEAEYRPISTRQTVDRIQDYLAQTVQNKLSICSVGSELENEDTRGEGDKGKGEFIKSQTPDYLYKIELGVTRLVLSKSLFSTTLMGEAEANINENRQRSKKIWVDSFGGKVVLEKFGAQDAESDAELKSATSKVVEFLGNKLGGKLCSYFN